MVHDVGHCPLVYELCCFSSGAPSKGDFRKESLLLRALVLGEDYILLNWL